MKKAIGTIFPFLIIHLICCGSILLFLISSGYLLLLSNESQNKWFLLPSLLALFLAWRELNKIEQKPWKILLTVIIYLIISYIFITYLFIPWWIPGYEGG